MAPHSTSLNINLSYSIIQKKVMQYASSTHQSLHHAAACIANAAGCMDALQVSSCKTLDAGSVLPHGYFSPSSGIQQVVGGNVALSNTLHSPQNSLRQTTTTSPGAGCCTASSWTSLDCQRPLYEGNAPDSCCQLLLTMATMAVCHVPISQWHQRKKILLLEC